MALLYRCVVCCGLSSTQGLVSMSSELFSSGKDWLGDQPVIMVNYTYEYVVLGSCITACVAVLLIHH